MKTEIVEYDRSAFKGLKFQFVCDKIYLYLAETPSEAIEKFKDFNGYEPERVVQLSRYPSSYQS